MSIYGQTYIKEIKMKISHIIKCTGKDNCPICRIFRELHHELHIEVLKQNYRHMWE